VAYVVCDTGFPRLPPPQATFVALETFASRPRRGEPARWHGAPGPSAGAPRSRAGERDVVNGRTGVGLGHQRTLCEAGNDGDNLVKVQLLSFPGCPNVDAARDALRRVLVSTGRSPYLEEVDVTAPQTPEPLRRWGSPTILVDGTDVAGESPAGCACRLYEDGENRGVPSDEIIRRALATADSR
jgi:hypothetical protein